CGGCLLGLHLRPVAEHSEANHEDGDGGSPSERLSTHRTPPPRKERANSEFRVQSSGSAFWPAFSRIAFASGHVSTPSSIALSQSGLRLGFLSTTFFVRSIRAGLADLMRYFL